MTRFLPAVSAAILLAPLVAAGVASADEWGTLKGKFVLEGPKDPVTSSGGIGQLTPEQQAKLVKGSVVVTADESRWIYLGNGNKTDEKSFIATSGPLKADKDVEVCGKHKLLNEELVVGADKGVANVVVVIRDKDVKVNPAAMPTGPVVLDNKNCRFEPHVVFVQVGQELVIKNSDTAAHNSNISTRKNPQSNTLIQPGAESKLKFTSEEPIPPAEVTCNVHPWMKGWIVVRSNPYAAVSKADGTFEIKDAPVGEVELQFWHEKAGYLGEMTIGGKAEKVSKGRKKVAVTAGGTDLGEIVLAPALFQK